jgi:pyruvate dehydrogenase complex dehydrogenase (E1) component
MEWLSSFDALVQFAGENVNFDILHFNFNQTYEIRAKLPMKDISVYSNRIEEVSKNSYQLFEFLMRKSLKKKYLSLPKEHWKP